MIDVSRKHPDKKMNNSIKKNNFIINNSENVLINTSYQLEYLIFFENIQIIFIITKSFHF